MGAHTTSDDPTRYRVDAEVEVWKHRDPVERVAARAVESGPDGENLAAGVPTPEEAVAGWLQSPAHCQNLMDPRFTDMGVGFTVNPKDPSVIFWTQVFAQALPGSAARMPQ